MLIPRRVKHRKQHRPHRDGLAKGGTQLAFGDYGIQSLESSYLTNRHYISTIGSNGFSNSDAGGTSATMVNPSR